MTEHFETRSKKGRGRAQQSLDLIDAMVWSEKGTVRGVLQPVLDDYAVGFRVMHGFSSATTVIERQM